MESTKERAALYLNSFGWGRGVPITGIDFDSLVVMLSGFASAEMTGINKEAIISKLDEWINDCQTQSEIFYGENMTHAEVSSTAMGMAYKRVKKFINTRKS